MLMCSVHSQLELPFLKVVKPSGVEILVDCRSDHLEWNFRLDSLDPVSVYTLLSDFRYKWPGSLSSCSHGFPAMVHSITSQTVSQNKPFSLMLLFARPHKWEKLLTMFSYITLNIRTIDNIKVYHFTHVSRAHKHVSVDMILFYITKLNLIKWQK